MDLCFFFNDTATTEIYTLSLHDALPIFGVLGASQAAAVDAADEFLERVRATLHLTSGRDGDRLRLDDQPSDRKSTRLNSSHANISYAVFCLKKKKQNLH